MSGLKKQIEQIDPNTYSIFEYASGKELMEYLECTEVLPDVIMMDIELGEENGVELAANIKRRFTKIKIIFVTGHKEEYIESLFLQIKPFGVLGKPVNNEILCQLLRQAEEKKTISDSLTIKYKNMISNIQLDDITFIESDKRLVYIHTVSGVEKCYTALDSVAEKMTGNFLRCHKSYLVNMDMIKHYYGNRFELFNGEEVPISRNYLSYAKQIYMKYIGMEM